MIDNRMALEQLRRGFDQLLAESPDAISLRRPTLVSDGFGGWVADPSGATTLILFTGRLSHERYGTRPVEPFPSGLDTTLSLFLQWRWNNVVNEGEIIMARGRMFKVGAVDPIKKFGGVYCNQAPLYQAGSVPA